MAISSIPAVKTGLRQFLATQPGLTTADGVKVHSAPVTFEEAGDRHLILADVNATRTQVGLVARSETVTLTCWSAVTVARDDETARAAARDAAHALFAIADQAIQADPTAAGTVPPPGRLIVTSSTLEETPVEIDGAAGRKAQLSFQLSWTSHL